MLSMDLGSGEWGGHFVVALRGELDRLEAADLPLAAPRPRVRRVLAIIWEGDGSAVYASVAAAAASEGAPRRMVAPIQG